MEKHGVGIVQAIKEFSKLDDTLREFFGPGAEGLESRFIQNIIKVEKSKKDSENWIILKDQILAQTILDSFADPDKKIMLETAMDKPLAKSELFDKCNLSGGSDQDKLNHLIDNGLIVPVLDGESNTPKYQTTFSNVKMDLDKKSIVVKIQLQKICMQQSSILQVIQ